MCYCPKCSVTFGKEICKSSFGRVFNSRFGCIATPGCCCSCKLNSNGTERNKILIGDIQEREDLTKFEVLELSWLTMEFITDRHLWNKVGYQWNGTERNKKFRLLNLQCLQLSRVQTPTPGLGSRLGLGGRLDLTKLPTGK